MVGGSHPQASLEAATLHRLGLVSRWLWRGRPALVSRGRLGLAISKNKGKPVPIAVEGMPSPHGDGSSLTGYVEKLMQRGDETVNIIMFRWLAVRRVRKNRKRME
ncbi:MAG: hypothetical protein A2Z25_07245 [Planctomycetes bacterium RBG_16_55_9]|nr:MAG: hypothetical protein A2Z25_07245 [Planctomycetes bacterium RBG_16_55_9]